jgi:signal transduction histidine kinase
MQEFVGASLKTRLYLLLLAAFIPVAILIYYVAEEQKAIETGAILQKTLLLTRASANEENQQMESTRNLLATVADAYLMVGGHGERLSVLLANLLRQAKGYADFGVLDPDGRLVAGGDRSGSGRDYSDRDWFAASLRNKDLTMGQYHGEHIGGEPVVYFALPIPDSRRQVRAVVFAAMNLNWMNRTIFKRLAELPEGARLALLDETRGILRYDADAGKWSVPKNFSPALREEIANRQSGTLSATDEDGVSRIYAFAPLASSFRNRTVSVVLEIPQGVALAASKRIFTRNLALLMVSALMAVLAIWWAGNVYILRRVRAMVRASRKLAAGDLNVRIGRIGVRDELSHLAGVFDEMAASLQLRIERESQVMGSLERSREQLRKLAVHQQKVREEERIRIAREIHDQFGQSLTILKMDLSWLKKQLPDRSPEITEKMGAMSQVIDEALKNLHAVTAELRPAILDDFGLAAAIEWQVEEFQNHSGIDCRMENSDFEPDLPKDQATTLFRIFQETLTNIIRHAEADAVVVRLEKDNGSLILQVEDNGRGITDAEINDPNAYGLLGIRERLYPWNGRVSFEGRPGQGTRVTVLLPMPPKGEAE